MFCSLLVTPLKDGNCIEKTNVNISFFHVKSYVTCWLEIVLNTKMSNIYHVGITKGQVKEECEGAVNVLSSGQSSVVLKFTCMKKGIAPVIVVVVMLASIFTLMKYDKNDPLLGTMCNTLVKLNMKSLEEYTTRMSNLSSMHSSFEHDLENDCHCFTLPVRTRNTNLVRADIQLRYSTSSRNVFSSGEYFENSLNDTMGSDYLVVNGIDINSLKPGQRLTVNMIHFWFKWLVTPRAPNDVRFQIYAAPPLLMTSVLANGYTTSVQKLIREVNIIDKKLVLFPVYAGQHWSLVAVFNPSRITETAKKWNDRNYDGDVTAIVHLDPKCRDTLHNQNTIANAVRNLLNKSWAIHVNTSVDMTSIPFYPRRDAAKLRTMIGKLFCVEIIISFSTSVIFVIFIFSYSTPVSLHLQCCSSVPTQCFDHDSGVYVCLYAVKLMEMVTQGNIKMANIMDEFSNFLGEKTVFDFDGQDVHQFRADMHRIAMNVREIYQNDGIETASNLLQSESDADDANSTMSASTNDDANVSSIEDIDSGYEDEEEDGSYVDDATSLSVNHDDIDLDLESDLDGETETVCLTAVLICSCSSSSLYFFTIDVGIFFSYTLCSIIIL